MQSRLNTSNQAFSSACAYILSNQILSKWFSDFAHRLEWCVATRFRWINTNSETFATHANGNT
jgi:hypothetical protein